MLNIMEEITSKLRTTRNRGDASRRQKENYDVMASKFGVAAEGCEDIQAAMISISSLAEEAGNWDLAEHLQVLTRRIGQLSEELQNCRSICKNIAD